MSLAEIENVTKAWPPISRAVRVPRTEADYHELVELLDRITDEVGEDENHPLASLMDVLGVLNSEIRRRACAGANPISQFIVERQRIPGSEI